MADRPGEAKLKAAIAKHRARTRTTDPEPYDPDWGWWMEHRIHRLEIAAKWLIGLAAGALVAEVLRVALQALGIAP
jgi:hypothetical protein